MKCRGRSQKPQVCIIRILHATLALGCLSVARTEARMIFQNIMAIFLSHFPRLVSLSVQSILAVNLAASSLAPRPIWVNNQSMIAGLLGLRDCERAVIVLGSLAVPANVFWLCNFARNVPNDCPAKNVCAPDLVENWASWQNPPKAQHDSPIPKVFNEQCKCFRVIICQSQTRAYSTRLPNIVHVGGAAQIKDLRPKVIK